MDPMRYLIQTRNLVDPIIQDEEKWENIDQECEFNDLELAFRVAHIVANASTTKEFRVVRDDGYNYKPIPTV